jgi:hypothetical protein
MTNLLGLQSNSLGRQQQLIHFNAPGSSCAQLMAKDGCVRSDVVESGDQTQRDQGGGAERLRWASSLRTLSVICRIRDFLHGNTCRRSLCCTVQSLHISP